MTTVRYIALAALLFGIFNASVCSCVLLVAILVPLFSLVLTYRNTIPARTLAHIGFLLLGISSMLWTGTRNSIPFLAGVSAAFLLGAVVARLPQTRTTGRLIRSLLFLGALGTLTQSSLLPLLIQSCREKNSLQGKRKLGDNTTE